MNAVLWLHVFFFCVCLLTVSYISLFFFFFILYSYLSSFTLFERCFEVPFCFRFCFLRQHNLLFFFFALVKTFFFGIKYYILTNVYMHISKAALPSPMFLFFLFTTGIFLFLSFISSIYNSSFFSFYSPSTFFFFPLLLHSFFSFTFSSFFFQRFLVFFFFG